MEHCLDPNSNTCSESITTQFWDCDLQLSDWDVNISTLRLDFSPLIWLGQASNSWSMQQLIRRTENINLQIKSGAIKCLA
jgi:hypothetical protein